MAIHFFDTSALGKHYHPEVGTPNVDRLLSLPGEGHTISRITVVEMVSVFARKVRTGALTFNDFEKVTRRFRGDVAARRIQVVRLLVAHFQLAEQLLRRHAPTKNLRTLDALQLAVALRFHAANPIHFVCADQTLCALAAVEGLKVTNPELP